MGQVAVIPSFMWHCLKIKETLSMVILYACSWLAQLLGGESSCKYCSLGQRCIFLSVSIAPGNSRWQCVFFYRSFPFICGYFQHVRELCKVSVYTELLSLVHSVLDYLSQAECKGNRPGNYPDKYSRKC